MASDDNQSYKPVSKSDAQWQRELGENRFKVLRQKATEPPFSGIYYQHKQNGDYLCAGCGALLFHSTEKYDSGSGWPSFFKAARPEAIRIERDTSHGMIREEILCARCGGHLGHRFPDGPLPAGMRYCVNSLSLRFTEKDEPGREK